MMQKLKLGIRSLNFLRIIAMILIVMHHYAYHVFNLSNIPFHYNRIIVNILSLGGKFSVNIFIMISAYFNVDHNISIKVFLEYGENLVLFHYITSYIWKLP